MKLKEIYQLFVEKGREKDPRTKEEVDRLLQKKSEEYAELKDEKKQYADLESLSNPYSDTRILYGDGETEISTVFAGVDIDSSEILLVDRLREKGEKIDLVISHHPVGKALINLYDVMELQVDVFRHYGVPVNIAQGLMDKRIEEVKNALLPYNYNQPVDAAKLLDIPLMCAHTPADNCVNAFLDDFFTNKELYYVKDVINSLLKLEEFHEAAKVGAGPMIMVGKDENRAGKVMVSMTGGTSPAKETYEHLSNHGVGTIVDMHMSEEHRKEAEKNHLNVVIAGHMASDSLGMNLLLDELENRGVKVIAGAGLIRVKR